MPPRLPGDRKRKQKNNSGTMVAMSGMLFMTACLFGLAGMVLGAGAVYILGIGFLLVLFIAFHYLVWGKWLTKRLGKPDDTE